MYVRIVKSKLPLCNVYLTLNCCICPLSVILMGFTVHVDVQAFCVLMCSCQVHRSNRRCVTVVSGPATSRRAALHGGQVRTPLPHIRHRSCLQNGSNVHVRSLSGELAKFL